MTSPTGLQPRNNSLRGNAGGFTLIELIVVMGMLSTLFALSAPSLSRFFRGHSLQEEARRFLALTRFAQNEAVSLAIPLEIRIDVNLQKYGLFPQAGYEWPNRQEWIFSYEEEIRLELIPNQNGAPADSRILFGVDGTLDESSLQAVRLYRENEESFYIAQAEYGQRYEVLTQEEYERLLRYRSSITGIR